MPRYFRNRRGEEINDFLEAHGFFIQSGHGDDRIYAREGFGYTVKTPDRKSEVIPLGTMSQILKCIRMCGIEDHKNIILEWWIENGYGE